jgi:NitT/TauT family transport system ATP-binding protein
MNELEIKNVSKGFRARSGHLHALQGVNLDIQVGEFVCLVGPSGCGKSTLLHLVAGFDRPDSGEIRLEGRLVEGPGPERVVVFQEGALFPWLTVGDNVAFGPKAQKIPLAERRQRVKEYLRLVHLEKFQAAHVHELSGGMRQRVAIARALVLEPRILLMDEPFAALDTQTRDLLVEELRGIWSELRNTILFVTHNVREAVYLADRVALFSFRPGRIKRVYTIDLPRPRDPMDPRLEEIVRSIVEELHAEVEKALKEEMGDEKGS